MLVWDPQRVTAVGIETGAEKPTVEWLDPEVGAVHGALSRLFKDKPHVVAEAIRALRKVPGDRDKWISTVLNSTPALRGMAEAAHREIEYQ